MIRPALLLACAVTLAGCGTFLPHNSGNAGNPNGFAYAGEPGSVFAIDGPPRPVSMAPDPGAPAPVMAPGSAAGISQQPLQPVTPAPAPR